MFPESIMSAVQNSISNDLGQQLCLHKSTWFICCGKQAA